MIWRIPRRDGGDTYLVLLLLEFQSTSYRPTPQPRRNGACAFLTPEASTTSWHSVDWATRTAPVTSRPSRRRLARACGLAEPVRYLSRMTTPRDSTAPLDLVRAWLSDPRQSTRLPPLWRPERPLSFVVARKQSVRYRPISSAGEVIRDSRLLSCSWCFVRRQHPAPIRRVRLGRRCRAVRYPESIW
jgi:hypothetical protein